MDIVTDDTGESTRVQFSYISITKSLKGGLPAGDEIIVMLNGDGTTVIDEGIRDSGGYFKQGDNLLLFLNKKDGNDTLYKQYNPARYEIDHKGPYIFWSSYQGRFWLNKADKIQHGKNKTSHGLFKNLKSLDELETKYNLE